MKKIIILAILCVMNAISLKALNTARVTLIFDNSMSGINERVDIVYDDFNLYKQFTVDTFRLNGNQAEQIIDFKANEMGFYNLLIDGEGYLGGFFVGKNDCVAVKVSYKEDDDSYIDSTIFNTNITDDYFRSKFVLRFNYDRNYTDTITFIENYLAKCDSLYDYNVALAENELFNKIKLTDEEKRFILGYLSYSKADLYARFLFYNFYNTLLGSDLEPSALVEKYVNKLFEDKELNNFDFYDRFSKNPRVSNYVTMVRNIIEVKLRKKIYSVDKSDPFSFHKVKIDYYKKTFNKNFTSCLIFEYIYSSIDGANSLEELSNIETLIKNNKESLIYEEYYNRLMEKVNIGKELRSSKEFGNYILLDSLGIEHTISEYNGHYVYLCLWATWCSACHQYFPYLEDLYQKYKNTDLKIVNLAIDKMPIEKIIRHLDKYNLSFDQLVYKGNFYSPLCKDLSINSLPHYLILDKEGKIINPVAPFPVQEKSLKREFEKLGIKID